MDELLVGLRAIAESTRVRILFILSHGEFNVSELTQILGQSQPRVSRHLKLMVEAGMVSRHKEGNWVLFRLREEGLGGALSRAIVDMLPAYDSALTRDLARLESIRTQRAELAASYFSNNAANWEKLRSLHIREEDVEEAMQAILGKARVKTLVDLGTGTGRVLELFAPQADQAIGIDSSREMLAIARSNLGSATSTTGFGAPGMSLTLPDAPCAIHSRITVFSSSVNGVLPLGGMARSSDAGKEIRTKSSLFLASPARITAPCLPPRKTAAKLSSRISLFCRFSPWQAAQRVSNSGATRFA